MWWAWTRQMLLVEQEQLALPEHLSSNRFYFCGIRAQFFQFLCSV